MSFRFASKENTASKTLNSSPRWVRNPSWPQLPNVESTDNKFVGLHKVEPDSNFLALTAAGNYTVDWGDGSAPENFNSGVVAYKQYSFDTAALDGTNAPVTLTDSGDLVTRTAHGYQNGNTVSFYNIVSTTGLTENRIYYVINATENTFQVSETYNGSPIALTTDGSATLLPYKMAIVTVTPQAGQTFTSLDLHRRHNQTGLTTYVSGFIDIIIAGSSLTTLYIGSDAAQSTIPPIRFTLLEQVSILSSSNMSGYRLFRSCSNLQNIEKFFPNSITNAYEMFSGCELLKEIPSFNTNASDMSGMFRFCALLEEAPYLNTQNTTQMVNMFNACISLKTVPLYNTANVTNMNSMFSGCRGLTTVPLFNTANVTNMNSMFSFCTNLKYVPLFNTVKVTDMFGMLGSCSLLREVPLFNTGAVTNMSSMLDSCKELTTVPLFNTANVTNMSFMFNACSSLKAIPLFNTVKVTNMQGMFASCVVLETVPLFNTAVVTNTFSMFSACYSLTSVPFLNVTSSTDLSITFSNCSSLTKATLSNVKRSISYGSCKLSSTELTNIINNLQTIGAANQTLTIFNNWGAVTPVSLSGTTTAGSTTITMANTTGISVGMQVTGTGTPSTTAVACTFTDTGDLVTKTAHGLSNGDEVSFATITTTTGITTNRIYYVVNATTDTFQVALTSGGAAIALTNNGSGTLRYRATVTAITTNTNVTISRPATSSGTNTLAFRTLNTQTALLKGWAVSG